MWQKKFQQYGDDSFTIVGLALDVEGVEPAKRYYEKFGVTFPSLVDPNYATRFGAVPKTFFVDELGVVQSARSWERRLKTLPAPRGRAGRDSLAMVDAGPATRGPFVLGTGGCQQPAARRSRPLPPNLGHATSNSDCGRKPWPSCSERLRSTTSGRVAKDQGAPSPSVEPRLPATDARPRGRSGAAGPLRDDLLLSQPDDWIRQADRSPDLPGEIRRPRGRKPRQPVSRGHASTSYPPTQAVARRVIFVRVTRPGDSVKLSVVHRSFPSLQLRDQDMQLSNTRRQFLQHSAVAAAAFAAGQTLQAEDKKPRLFEISLAQWTINRELKSGQIDNLDFAKVAQQHGIFAIEYVNQFFMDKAKDKAYLGEMKMRAADLGVKSLILMCDREGRIGDPESAKRNQTVENHRKWIDAAKFLGCHSIRVNAGSEGSWQEQVKLAADGLAKLTEHGAEQQIDVIVENHGGLSSNADWLAEVIRAVDHRRLRGRCRTSATFASRTAKATTRTEGSRS